MFSAFKKNGTWQVPTFGALRSVWDARRAQLNPDDAAATDSAAKKTVEMFADMRKAGVKVLAGSDLPDLDRSHLPSTTSWWRWCAPA